MTVMLLSTLVPTVIHLFFALFALAVIRPPYAARVAYHIQEDQHGAEPGSWALVALYLSASAAFALLTLWAFGRLAIIGLDAMAGPQGIWVAIFETADLFIVF